MRNLLEKIERLEAENRDMREVLSFYASFDNWHSFPDYIQQYSEIDESDWDDIIGLAENVGGRRAREVLAKWGEK
jgi:hypothetical protein